MKTEIVGIGDKAIAIINRYKLNEEERKEALENEIVRHIKELCKRIENKNPYLWSYINNIEASFIMAGLEGVKAQIGYILCNFRARTEGDKEIKEQLKKIYKEL